MSTSRQGGVNEEMKIRFETGDRLIHPTQTEQESSRNSIRNARVRDLKL
jgi:hypothetical protein